ncbi:MAG: phosphodiester glycosidase family protein [Treponema sp.]|nr:phosphodiester glycosidase family protein [Treponema sp.]
MGKYLDLAEDAYCFGGFTRKNFRGYTLYWHFHYFDFSLSKRGGRCFWQDRWVETLLAEGRINAATFASYQKEVTDFVNREDFFWDLSNEELYLLFHRIRMRHIGTEALFRPFHRMAAYMPGNMSVTASLPPAAVLAPLPLLAHVAAPREEGELLRGKNAVLLAPGDASLLPEVIEKAGRYIGMGKTVFLVLKSSALSPGASLADFDFLLARDRRQGKTPGRRPEETVSRWFSRGLLRITEDPIPGRGADLSRLPWDEELSRLIAAKDIFLCAYGEEAFLSVRNLRIPAIAYTTARNLYAQAVLNVFAEDHKTALYIPAGLNIFPHVPLVELTRLSYGHLAYLAGLYGEGVYALSPEELRARYPECFVNIYGDLPELDRELYRGMNLAENDWKTPVVILRKKADRLAVPGKHGFVICHDFSPNNDSDGEGEKKRPAGAKPVSGEPDRVLINGLVVEESAGARICVINSYGGRSFRQFARDSGFLEEPRYMCNFLFYTTGHIVDFYNRLRTDRPDEQIGADREQVDFFLERENEKTRQSFPLYRKACIALDGEGNFHFFHFSLGCGKLRIGAFEIAWDAEQVNRLCPGKPAIFTPCLSREDEEADPFFYRKAVGRGRLNLVIIGSRVRCIRRGDVLLPSIGVVVSLPEETGRTLVDFLGLRERAGGYYPPAVPEIGLDLQGPAALAPEIWRKLRWAYGGGISLIRKHRGIFDGGADGIATFRQEGWLSPLSRQTQESPVHDTSARHPRTALGLTAKGQLCVIVFSGRSALSRGVNYREMCDLARRYFGDLADLVNVDGGASSFLGFGGGGTFTELSYPACSDTTPTGLVRPVSSLLII